MQYRPDTSVFPGTATLFAPVAEDGSPDTDAAMFSYAIPPDMDGFPEVSDYRHGLSLFESNGARYVGLSAPVRLYSKNAPRGGEWRLAVLVPEAELTAYAAEKSRGVTVLLAVLFVCAVGLAVFLSRRYLAPVLRGLEQIKRRGGSDFKPTNITEIDDLMDFLAEQGELREAERRETEQKLAALGVAAEEAAIVLPCREDYEEFLKNLATLTRTEREVFDLYMEGRRAKDMPALLFRSKNTIKTHNRNIYDKLRVSSREELMGYIKLMRETEEVTGVGTNRPS
jgi:DNA-binding CsgD family transcriptional regulator